MSEICDCEELWQWSWLEIRLNGFRRSTIPQKQFIIIKLEVTTSLGYLAWSLTEVSHSTHISSTSSSCCYPAFTQLEILRTHPGTGKNLFYDVISMPWSDQLWLSDTNLQSLDCPQNHDLRFITWQLVSTPLEAVRPEAGIQNYHTASKIFLFDPGRKLFAV